MAKEEGMADGTDTTRSPSPVRPSGPSTPGRGGNGRAIVPRQALPAGRAVVGGFLVAFSSLGLFVAYQGAARGPTTKYVVAARDLTIGHRLTSGDLRLATIELPGPMARDAAFADADTVVGATLVSPLRRGELVQSSAVVAKRSGPEAIEVSFALDTDRALGGRLRAGDVVDVLATFGVGSDTYTAVVVHGASVVAVDRGRGTLGEGRTETITLAVTSTDQALAVSHAINAGEVTLVRTTGSAVANTQDGGPTTYRAPSSQSPTTTARDR